MLEFINGTSTCSNLGSTTECVYEFLPIFATSTGTSSTSTLTVGEIATVQILTAILIAHITIYLIFALSNVYKKRKYLQYGGGDVEIREDH